MSADRGDRIRAAVRLAGDLAAAPGPAETAMLAEELLYTAHFRVDARDIVAALGWLLDALPEDTGPSDDDAAWGVRDVHEHLEDALERWPEAGMTGGSCDLGSALVALATRLAGRAPLWAPAAHPVSDEVAVDAARVLGWATSADPVRRLVAALTAPDPRLVEPLRHDADLLVRIAATGSPVRGVPDPSDAIARLLPSATALDGENDETGELAPTLVEAGLAVPELATRLADRGAVRRVGPWHWATQPFPRAFDDYLFDPTPLLGPVVDQLSISHAGHGVNSYALNLRLALGPVAVLAQTGWGGVYMDSGRASDDWDDLVAGVDGITELLPLERSGHPARRRWLVLLSTFRENPLPDLLHWEGGAWHRLEGLFDDGSDDGSSEDAEGRFDPHRLAAARRARWTAIRDVIAGDLLVHEQRWWRGDSDAEEPEEIAVVPTPTEAEDGLVAVVDSGGLLHHVEYTGGDDLLVRRHGVWTFTEEDDERGHSPLPFRLGPRDRIHISPADLSFLDAAAEIGAPVTASLLRRLGEG